MLDHAGGADRSDTSGGARHAGNMQFLPEPGDTGEDGDDSRRDKPRTPDPRRWRGVERAGVSIVRVALRSSRGPLRGGLEDPEATYARRACRFRGTLLSGAKLRDRAPRSATRRTAVDGGKRRGSTHAQVDRTVRRPLEHRLHGQT